MGLETRGVDLQRNLDHGVASQGAIQIVQLLSACGPDGEGHTEVVASFAGAHLDGGRIEVWIELLCKLAHGFGKAVNPCAHDFDGKVTGVFNQGCFCSVGAQGAHWCYRTWRLGGGAHVNAKPPQRQWPTSLKQSW